MGRRSSHPGGEPAEPVRPAGVAGSDHAARRRLRACRSSARPARATRRSTRRSTASTSGATRCRPRPKARSATRSSTSRRCLWTFLLSLRVFFANGFDVIHACNPPDLFFLIGNFFKLFGKKFVFDHHDANPELYEAKFGRRDLLLEGDVPARAPDLPLRRRLDRHQQFLPPHRHRARRHAARARVRGAQRPEPGAPQAWSRRSNR